ncbi:ABC-three component system middle component 7 [Pseudovibrio sp. WM33]|uniref:ABC-three component system middle component 7 n=1 Tax=Pseudovibrio sp. WM33 TaxID=1735585 RepID=UPI0007AE7158|nr:hypothetical protein PsWM33_02466 [Pseudovibrio sp. WM33]
MIIPNKFHSLDQSILGKCPILLSHPDDHISIKELYRRNRKNFEDVSEFILALDLLYLTSRIEIDFDLQVVKYAL